MSITRVTNNVLEDNSVSIQKLTTTTQDILLPSINGFTYSYGTTNTITVSPGVCVLNNNTIVKTNNTLTLNVATSGVNGLQSAVAPNTPYYLYLIYNPTTTAVASFGSTSPTPVLPTGFTLSRLIGTFCTKNDSTVRNFLQKGQNNSRKLYFNDTGLVAGVNYSFSDNNLVFEGNTGEPVGTGTGIALGYTVNLSPLILRNNFIHSAIINYQGLSLAGVETAYRIGARFTGTAGYMVASSNYNGISNGQYDVQGELPLNMTNSSATDLEIWYSRNAGANQKDDRIQVYCHGLSFEV